MHHNYDEIYSELVQKTRCILETLVSADVCCALWKLSALRTKPTGDRTEINISAAAYILLVFNTSFYVHFILFCIESFGLSLY